MFCAVARCWVLDWCCYFSCYTFKGIWLFKVILSSTFKQSIRSFCVYCNFKCILVHLWNFVFYHKGKISNMQQIIFVAKVLIWHLKAYVLFRVLQRWADHILQAEHNIWRYENILISQAASREDSCLFFLLFSYTSCYVLKLLNGDDFLGLWYCT